MRASGNTYQKPGFKDNRILGDREYGHIPPSTHQGRVNTDEAQTQFDQNPVVKAFSVTEKLASRLEKSSRFLLVSDLVSLGSLSNKKGSKHSTPVVSPNNSFENENNDKQKKKKEI